MNVESPDIIVKPQVQTVTSTFGRVEVLQPTPEVSVTLAQLTCPLPHKVYKTLKEYVRPLGATEVPLEKYLSKYWKAVKHLLDGLRTWSPK